MIKFLIQQGAGANFFIRSAWVNALSAMGHQVVYWNDQEKSALDIFYEFRPDVFIGSTWQLNSALVKAIIKYPQIKVLLCANNWSDNDEQVKALYPIEFASDNEKNYVRQLKQAVGKPDFVLCQYHDKYAQETHKLWKTLDCELFGMLLSADITEYQLTTPDKKAASDVVFVGGYWPYKAKQIAPYLFPLARVDINLNMKVFGFGAWPIPNFLGNISSQTASLMYSSAKVCPNIFEPHSLDLGYDVNQRTYQVAAAGGFQICQDVKSVKEDVFPNGEIVFANDPEDFISKCLLYIQSPELRLPYIKNSIDTVYRYHTNFHRVANILEKIGENAEADKALNIAKTTYDQVVETVNSDSFDQGYFGLFK